HREIRRGGFRGRQISEFRQLSTPQQGKIVSMRLEEADESIEVQRSDRSLAPPILQRVPRLRSAQDERSAARFLEVIRIPGLSERSCDGSRHRALVVVLAFLNQCRTGVET